MIRRDDIIICCWPTKRLSSSFISESNDSFIIIWSFRLIVIVFIITIFYYHSSISTIIFIFIHTIRHNRHSWRIHQTHASQNIWNVSIGITEGIVTGCIFRRSEWIIWTISTSRWECVYQWIYRRRCRGTGTTGRRIDIAWSHFFFFNSSYQTFLPLSKIKTCIPFT